MKYTVDHLPFRCWKNIPIAPKALLIHFISAINTHPDDPYNPKHIRYILERYGFSAHLFIDRNGDVTEWVPLNRMAYHCNPGRLREITSMNAKSIGIELAGRVDDDYTDAQYDSLAIQTNSILDRFNIPTYMVKGHEDVADHTVRPNDPKVDPGPYFDWLRFGQLTERYS